VFCGWGLCVAVAGVALAPRLAARLGERHAAAAAVFGYAVLMLVLAVPSKPVLVAGIVVSGLVSGLLNTLFTGTAMSISDAPRPVASAGYNFCRWLGGAVAATLVGHVAEWFGSPQAPFIASAVLCVVAGALLSLREKKADPHTVPQEAVLVGEEF
jgi:MFS family permease